MKTLFKISWRNVWRNRARSIVIILAIGFGLWGGIFATGLMTGMIRQQFNSSIRNQVSHIQIHNPEFIKERETGFTVSGADDIARFLDSSDKVQAYTKRTLATAMLATASMTSGVEIYGINPEQEDKTTDFESNIIDGDYLGTATRNPLMIGKALADRVNISTGSRIVMTFQDLNGEITSALFRVSGIYRTANTANDQRFVYVRQADLEGLLDGSGIINEIAILLHDLDDVSGFHEELQTLFPDNEIRTWAQISPDLSFINEFSGMMMMILVIIILVAIAFGLLNTMLMTIFERTQELGVLMSIGMKKPRVFSMILLETTFLVLTGSVFGVIIGSLTVALTGNTGIDLTPLGGEAFSEFGFDPVIYPVLDQMFYFNLAILVLTTAIIASIYPAWKALRLKPAEAVRKV
jgi:putative ABC transport system permease protein